MVKSADFVTRTKPFDLLTAVSGVGSSHTRGTCETSQVLLAGVAGVFRPHRTDWPVFNI